MRNFLDFDKCFYMGLFLMRRECYICIYISKLCVKFSKLHMLMSLGMAIQSAVQLYIYDVLKNMI